MKTIDIEGKGNPLMSSDLVIKDHETGVPLDLTNVTGFKLVGEPGWRVTATITSTYKVGKIDLAGVPVKSHGQRIAEMLRSVENDE